MIVAVVLAAGKGTRINSAPLPKQFLNIGHSPMVVETVEKFSFIEAVEKIVIVVSQPWISHARDLFKGKVYFNKLVFCTGGETRQQSLFSACNVIAKQFGGEVGIISHDAARPFVSLRIIEDNIKNLKAGHASDTVFPCTDTIVESLDGNALSNIPNRKNLYQGQTPQSFICQDYIEAFRRYGEDDSITDAAKLLLKNGKKILVVKGEPFNIKVTSDFDIVFAEFLMAHR